MYIEDGTYIAARVLTDHTFVVAEFTPESGCLFQKVADIICGEKCFCSVESARFIRVDRRRIQWPGR